MAQPLFSSPVGLSQLDPPPSRRQAYPIASNSTGAGGDDGAIIFVTGAEVYQFNSNSIRGPQKPKAITTLWIDASNLAAGKVLTVQCSNGQKFVVAAGSAGYFIAPLPAPFTLTVSTNNGAGVTVVVIAYNYNVAFTGFNQYGTLQSPTADASGGSTGGSGGSGGFSGGSGGGGFHGCPIEGSIIIPLGSPSVSLKEFTAGEWVTIRAGEFELTATPSHQIYTNDGIAVLDKVRVGTLVVTEAGERVIKYRKVFKKKQTALRVHVPKSHLYYASGILSHNKQ